MKNVQVVESDETTHYSIIDQFGNAISATTTLNGALGDNAFGTGGAIHFVNNSGTLVTPGSGVFYTPATAVDWYDQQTLGLTNATTYWKSLAPRPVSNVYVTDRQGKNDGIHVAVVDDDCDFKHVEWTSLYSVFNGQKDLLNAPKVQFIQNKKKKSWLLSIRNSRKIRHSYYITERFTFM